MRHFEKHYGRRITWLRAGVLGANDGIVSVASLIVGVASANVDRPELLLAAVAGLVAGGMSMATGEYVSVSSQADSERADLDRESKEIAMDAYGERKELASIYVSRGLDDDLADKVAIQLMSYDALAAHARDELGIHEFSRAQPIQAAIASAFSFSLGALLPVVLVIIVPMKLMVATVAGSSLLLLTILGVISARIGGSNLFRGASRVAFWGILAMLTTASIGHLFEYLA
tara:strand:- start:181 stop:870 length:690 start_codon:yes stop_codon:yes gene_type:complete